VTSETLVCRSEWLGRSSGWNCENRTAVVAMIIQILPSSETISADYRPKLCSPSSTTSPFKVKNPKLGFIQYAINLYSPSFSHYILRSCIHVLHFLGLTHDMFKTKMNLMRLFFIWFRDAIREIVIEKILPSSFLNFLNLSQL
jgi:hypothetical protein